MNDQTLRRRSPAAKAGIVIPRQVDSRDKASKADHAGDIAKALAERFGRSAVARQHQIGRTKEFLAEVATLAVVDPVVREWVPILIGPLEAAVHLSDVDGTLQDAIHAKSAADAAENHHLVVFAQQSTRPNGLRLLLSLKQEQARIADLIVKLTQAMLAGELCDAQ